MVSEQIISSLISALGGVITGAMGGNWFSRKKSDQRCERICSLMVNGFDKLLTALEVAGEPPAMRTAIRDARDVIVVAKGYLGIGAPIDGQSHDGK